MYKNCRLRGSGGEKSENDGTVGCFHYCAGEHAKFRQYSSIEIDINTYFKYENAQKDLYGNSVRYGGKKYDIPATVFSAPENWYISTSTNPQNWWGFFHYDTGANGKSLISTGSVGRSIFWRTK